MTTVTGHEVEFDKQSMAAGVKSFLIAAAAVMILAVIVIFTTESAWRLLGAGRGLVSPGYYPVVGLVVLLGTTFGQFLGWAAGSALLAYVWCWVSASSAKDRIVQVSMTIVYLGLAAVPLFFYHVLFGQPLAGIERPQLTEWLSQNHPETYSFLYVIHPIVDWSLVPLGIGVLALIWGCFGRLRRDRPIQILFLFLVLLTSFAVALSLGAHSTLAHIRVSA